MLRCTRPYEIPYHVLNQKKALGTLQMPQYMLVGGQGTMNQPHLQQEKSDEQKLICMNHCLLEGSNSKSSILSSSGRKQTVAWLWESWKQQVCSVSQEGDGRERMQFSIQAAADTLEGEQQGKQDNKHLYGYTEVFSPFRNIGQRRGI